MLNPILVEEATKKEESKGKEKVLTEAADTSTIQHKNQFEVFSHETANEDSIRDAMKGNDKKLEKEINQDLADGEDIGSECSEFVDDSQEEDKKQDDITHISQVVGAETEIVQNSANENFPQQSWANIMEDEEAEKRLLHDIEASQPQGSHDDGFEVVKHRAKAPKKKATPVASRYGTRNNVGNPKPFK